jgi:hypothetical protein
MQMYQRRVAGSQRNRKRCAFPTPPFLQDISAFLLHFTPCDAYATSDERKDFAPPPARCCFEARYFASAV